LLLLAVSFTLSAQNDTILWYQNGLPEKWLPQHDVFLFKSFNNDAIHFEADSNMVIYNYFRNDKPDKLQVVYFHPYSSWSQRESWKQQVLQHPLFESSFPAITQNNSLPNTEGNWLATDDLISVQFHHNFYFDELYGDFIGSYRLMLQNEEAVSASVSINPVFVFKWNIDTTLAANTTDLCRLMYEQDSSIVRNAIPNKIVVFKPVPETVTSVLNHSATNDKDFYVAQTENKTLKIALKNNAAETTALQLCIINSLGQQVINAEPDCIGTGSCFIAGDKLPMGIYYAVLIADNNALYRVKKFLLQ